ncbi:CGNR zinc finger domain-containing protein [Solicola gregarius]|uniref:CGNR zinc finger domain-containing protein n=1 Tax=Solicola gregarius TaxID=2908642 RepID=UPI002FE134AB
MSRTSQYPLAETSGSGGCQSPTCDGMFVDTSRAGRRRYCMPELCGNRANVVNVRACQSSR